MKKLWLRIKFFFQGVYIVLVAEPILREKGRSMYTKREKQQAYDNAVRRLEELRLEISSS